MLCIFAEFKCKSYDGEYSLASCSTRWVCLLISKCTLHDILFKNKVWGDKVLSVRYVAMLCTADALLLGNCQ